MHMPYEHAASWCIQVWANSYEGESTVDMLDKMSEANVIFENEKQVLRRCTQGARVAM